MLFDVLNIRNLNDSKQMQRAITGSSSHVDFLSDMVKWLSGWEAMTKQRYPSINGWRLSVQAILGLWAYLQEKGFQFNLSSQINEDPIENLFSVIRQSGGARDNPNSEQFCLAF